MYKVLVFLFLLCSFPSFSQTLNSIESVEYDASQNRFFISNGSSIIARASDGTLSYFSSGKASHGMEVMGDILFVIDGDNIRGFDLVSEAEVMTLAIPGAGFLNGMTNDGDSILYATDFGNDQIYKINVADLANPSQEIIVQNTGDTPNGIIYDGDNNRVIFVTWTSSAPIKAVDLSDNSITTLVTTSVGSIDGIDEDGEKNYYISSWSPSRITKYDSTFSNPPEVITTPFLSSPADICYAKEIDTLAIPHYPNNGNEVVFVGFNTVEDTSTTATLNLTSSDLALKISPNPVSAQTVIQFNLEENTVMDLNIWNNEGRLIKNLLQGIQPQGAHTLSFTGMDIAPGIYWLHLSTQHQQKTIPLHIISH